MKFRRILALLLCVAALLSMPALAADETAEDAVESTENDAAENGEDAADEVLGMVEQILLKNKVEALLDIIEGYSLYEYAGDTETLLAAIAEYFTAHPEGFEEFADALFATQDGFSHYMEPETYDNSYVMNDSFVGIGIELESANDGLVKVVYPNTPAEEAGMKPGDYIFSVGGEVVPEGQFNKVFQEKLRGEEGTDVTVGVRREGAELEFTMTRRKVVLSNIAFSDLGNGIAYIRIAHFGNDISTFVDFVNAYTDLDEQGFTSVVFDVRNNNGGDAAVLANILNYTLWEKDVPMFTENSAAAEPYTHYSLGQGWEPENVCVLVNRYTASSAEIFTAVLQEAGATIIGEDAATYGKGLGQYVFQFTDGSKAIITGSEALIGAEMKSYHGVGIAPDLVVPLEYEVIEEPVEPNELDSRREFYPGARGDVVLAAEQRLVLLGYLDAEADNVYDEVSQAAMDAFRTDNGLRVSTLVRTEALDALVAATEGMATPAVTTVVDAPLAKAVELCGGEVE